jgi:hypothetical protein
MHSFKIYSLNARFVFFRKKEERHLDGEITFLDNRIIVNDTIFIIDALDSIKFLSFEDYIGRIIDPVDNKISEGVDNRVELHLNNRQKITYYFELTERYQIRDIREQLIHYHLAGKLDFLNLTAILGIEDYNAIQNFKQTLVSYGK